MRIMGKTRLRYLVRRGPRHRLQVCVRVSLGWQQKRTLPLMAAPKKIMKKEAISMSKRTAKICSGILIAFQIVAKSCIKIAYGSKNSKSGKIWRKGWRHSTIVVKTITSVPSKVMAMAIGQPVKCKILTIEAGQIRLPASVTIESDCPAAAKIIERANQ